MEADDKALLAFILRYLPRDMTWKNLILSSMGSKLNMFSRISVGKEQKTLKEMPVGAEKFPAQMEQEEEVELQLEELQLEELQVEAEGLREEDV